MHQQQPQKQTNQQEAQPQNNKKDQISQSIKEKVEAAKSYIERKYSTRKEEEITQRENWDQLQNIMNSLDIPAIEQEQIKKDILHKDAEQMRQKRQKLQPADFTPLAIIGRGAFGEVRLCKSNLTEEVVAIKKMKKQEMVFKNQVTHIRAERDVMALADNQWIVELKCAFQDEKYLYLVMEFLAGGDLMTLLMKKDILTEEEAKFFMAEGILAVDSVHKLNYIHRDLKPDNILIGRDGHIKLSDFGLCKHTETKPKKIDLSAKKIQEIEKPELQIQIGKRPGYRRNRMLAYTTVGTPDYIAPEVFGKDGYTETVDWWSLGVILFEMLVGYPPFFSEEPSITCQKILHWRKTLVIPQEANLSHDSIDLIRKLISDPNERLGINGVEEIKAHPFFAGIDWKKIKQKKAPYQPELSSETDIKYFDKFEEEDPWVPLDQQEKKKGRKEAHFIGYTFNRLAQSQQSCLLDALIDLESQKQNKLQNQNLNQSAATPQQQNDAPSQQQLQQQLEENKIQDNNDLQQCNAQKNNKQPLGGIDLHQYLKRNINLKGDDAQPIQPTQNSNLEETQQQQQQQQKQFCLSQLQMERTSVGQGQGQKQQQKVNLQLDNQKVKKRNGNNPQQGIGIGKLCNIPQQQIQLNNGNDQFKNFINSKLSQQIKKGANQNQILGNAQISNQNVQLNSQFLNKYSQKTIVNQNQELTKQGSKEIPTGQKNTNSNLNSERQQQQKQANPNLQFKDMITMKKQQKN